MQYISVVIICTLLAIDITSSSKSAVAADCATNLETLQNALYDKDGKNVLEFQRIFYPPNARSSRFIQVIYSFFDENNELDGCNVTYVWSIGEVLFIQPPTIFKYTSLYFNYPNNDLDFLNIQLPYECRGLVNTSSDGECSCVKDTNESSSILQVLTQQITVYTRYFDISSGERMETSARALCTSKLQGKYFNNNSNIFYILLCTTIIIPFVIISVLFFAFRGLSEGAASAITKSKPSLVSLVIVGFYLSLAIFIIDILVCNAVTTSSHEYADYVDSGSINLQINYMTLFIDALIFLSQIVCIAIVWMIYLQCFGIQKHPKAYSCLLNFIVHLIGKKNSKNFKQLSDNDIVAAIFPFMLFLSIISFSSHCIYIVLAWLTEPEKASFIFLAFYILIITLFYSFKFLYNNIIVYCVCTCNKLSCKKKDNTPESKPIKLEDINKSNDGNESNDENNDGNNESNVKNNEDLFINTQAFCLTLIFSILIVGFVIMIAAMFIIVPFQSASLIDYVVNVFQIIVLILSSQFALKVIFDVGFDLRSFIEVFKEALGKKKRLKNDNVKDVVQEKELYKVAGVITAELTSTILDLSKPPEQE